MTRCHFLAVIALALGVNPTVLAQNDPHIGTWKQNFAKSKSSQAPTGPQPQSATRTYEKFGDGLTYAGETVSADGKRTTSTYSAHYDGKDYPFKGSPNFDTIALKRIDAYTRESVFKKRGKVVATGVNAVSKDGKTMTWTFKGTDAQGQPTSGVQVYEKQ